MNDLDPADPRAIDYLRRKARSFRLQANRAAPALAAQLIALAAQYEIKAETAGATPRN